MVFIVGDATECRAGHVEALACDHSSGFLAVLSRPNGPETAEDVAADRILELWSLQPSLRKIGSAKFTLQSDGTRVASASILWHKDRSQLAVHCSNGDVAIFQIKLAQKPNPGQPEPEWWTRFGANRAIGTATETKQTLRLRKWCCVPAEGTAICAGKRDEALYVSAGTGITELDWMASFKSSYECPSTFKKLDTWDADNQIPLYTSEAVCSDLLQNGAAVTAAEDGGSPEQLDRPQCSRVVWNEAHRTLIALYHQQRQDTLQQFICVWAILGNEDYLAGMFAAPDGWQILDFVENDTAFASDGVQLLLCCQGTEEGSTKQQLYTMQIAVSCQHLTSDAPEMLVRCRGKSKLHNAAKAVNLELEQLAGPHRVTMQLHHTTAGPILLFGFNAQQTLLCVTASDMAGCFALPLGEPSTEQPPCFTMLPTARSLICSSNVSSIGNTLRQYRVAKRSESGLMPDGHGLLYCLQDAAIYFPDTETKEPYQDKFRRYKLPEQLKGSEILMGSSPSGKYIACAADGHALHPNPHCDRLYIFSRANSRWRTLDLASSNVDVTEIVGGAGERSGKSSPRTHRGRLISDCAVVGLAWITDELLLVVTRRRARYCLELVRRQMRDPRFAGTSSGKDAKKDAQNASTQDHILTTLPPGYKPLFLHKVIESQSSVPASVTREEGHAGSCLVTVGDRAYVNVFRVVYDAQQADVETGLNVTVGVLQSGSTPASSAPVPARIESVLEYDLDEAKLPENAASSKRLTFPISQAFILNSVAPTALAVVDRAGSLFRISVAANLAQFVMGDVLSIESVNLPANAPRSVLPCFLVQTASGERLWLPNMAPYDVTGPFHISERISRTALDTGATFFLGPAPASGTVLTCQQQWLVHTTDDDVALSPTGAISCRPVSTMVRLIVHLLHCQLAQGGLKIRSAHHTSFVHAVSRLITCLKSCPKGFLCFVEDLELFLHDMVEDDNFDSSEDLYSILISILFSTNELLLLELLCRVGRKTEPHISSKLFPLPARDVIPIPKPLERSVSTPVNRTMDVPPVGRRVRRADIAAAARQKAHRSPWTPYRLFELCLSAHNLYHAIRLLSLGWQDGTHVEEGSDTAVVRTYALSLELLYHSLVHCNVRCAVQCWGFAYRMESVLKEDMLVPFSTEITSGSDQALPVRLTAYRRKVFREGMDASTTLTSPAKLGLVSLNPVSWLVTSTGSLVWGVASTLDSAIQGARSYLQFPQLESDPEQEVVDPSNLYSDILSPTLLLSLKVLGALLKRHAFYPCAVFAQSICVTVEQFPSHLTSELLLLDTLHELVRGHEGGEADGDGDELGHHEDLSPGAVQEANLLALQDSLKKLADAFQLYNFTLFNFETKLRRLEQPEFIIHESCLRSMTPHRGHYMLLTDSRTDASSSLDRPSLQRNASSESLEITSLISAPDFESVASTSVVGAASSSSHSSKVPADHFDIPAGMNFTIESMLQWLCRIALLIGSLPTAAFLALILGDSDTLAMSLALFMLKSMKRTGDHGITDATFREIDARAKMCARALFIAIDRTDAEPSSNQPTVDFVTNFLATSDVSELPRRLSGRVLAAIAQATSRAGAVRHVRDVIELVCGIMSEPLVVAPRLVPVSPRPEYA